MSETDSARKSYFGIHASILFLYGGGSRVETLSNTHNSQKRIQIVESDTFCFLFGKFELGRGFLHVSQTIPRLKVTLGYTLRFYSGAPMRLVSKRSPPRPTHNSQTGATTTIDFSIPIPFGFSLENWSWVEGFCTSPDRFHAQKAGFEFVLVQRWDSCKNPLHNSQFPKRSQIVSKYETF